MSSPQSVEPLEAPRCRPWPRSSAARSRLVVAVLLSAPAWSSRPGSRPAGRPPGCVLIGVGAGARIGGLPDCSLGQLYRLDQLGGVQLLGGRGRGVGGHRQPVATGPAPSAGSAAGSAPARPAGNTAAAVTTPGSSCTGIVAATPASVSAPPVTATAAAPRRSGAGTGADRRTISPATVRPRATSGWLRCACRPRGERCRATTCLPDRRPGWTSAWGARSAWGVRCPFRDRAVTDPRQNVGNLGRSRTSSRPEMGRPHGVERRVAARRPSPGG